jgi:hypothetical protein
MSNTAWPKHADGRPMKMGEMTSEQRREQFKNAAVRVTAELTKTTEDAYREGHDAAEADLPLSANPYDVWKDEPFFDAWADGWVWQKREAERASSPAHQ